MIDSYRDSAGGPIILPLRIYRVDQSPNFSATSIKFNDFGHIQQVARCKNYVNENETR